MTRRIVHVVLLFVGIAPAVWAICTFGADTRRAAVLAALAALGLALNATALTRPAFGLRAALRLVACGVGLIVLAGVMAMWHWISDEYLPLLPASDLARRRMALTAAHNLLWIAAAVVYVLASVLALPRPAAGNDAPAGKAGRRTGVGDFGR